MPNYTEDEVRAFPVGTVVHFTTGSKVWQMVKTHMVAREDRYTRVASNWAEVGYGDLPQWSDHNVAYYISNRRYSDRSVVLPHPPIIAALDKWGA